MNKRKKIYLWLVIGMVMIFPQIITAQTTDYFASNGLFIPFTRISPPAIYDSNSNKTYITWQGTPNNLDPYVISYDHTTQNWSEPYWVGNNQLGNDEHGSPAIIRDVEGYLHVFFGTHNLNIQHAVSVNPDDVSQWITKPIIECGGASYQQCAVVPNGDIYIFYRKFLEYGPGYYNRTMGCIKSTDNGETWSVPYSVIDFSEIDNWIYPGGFEVEGSSKIHLSWTWCVPLSSPAIRRNAHHAYLDLADYHMYSMDGTDLGTTISKTEADAHCLAYNSGNHNIYNPKVHLDENGRPYIIFNNYETNFNHDFIYWNGDSWTTPETITSGTNAPDFIVHSSTDIEAYLTSAGYATMDKWLWDGTTWSFDSTIYDEQTTSYICLPKVVLNGVPELEVVFGEEQDDFTTPLNIYAWGDNGFVQNHHTGISEPDLTENDFNKINLYQNHPNPFNPQTTISFFLPKSGKTELKIYNIKGELIETLVNEVQQTGYHSMVWNAENVSSGIYLYRITSGEYESTKKCVIMK